MTIEEAHMARRSPGAAALGSLAILLFGAAAAAGPAQVTIVTEFPMDPGNEFTVRLVDAVQMAVVEHGPVGGLPVVVRVQDQPLPFLFSSHAAFAAAVAADAQAAIDDPSVVGVIGTFNSAAAELMIPDLNPSGLVMISPTNTYPGLTKPGFGMDMAALYPTGIRTYARVCPTDVVQGEDGADWMASLAGARARVVVLDDGEAYGAGVAAVFAARAATIGLDVVGRATVVANARDPKAALGVAASNFLPLVNSLAPDGIYFGGVADFGAPALRILRQAGFSGVFIGPDGMYDPRTDNFAGPSALEGAYVTLPNIYVPAVPAAAAWAADFESMFPGVEPDVETIYGYVATKVLLAALDGVASPFDRPAVTKAVLATSGFASPIGAVSFDPDGDTTSRAISGYLFVRGNPAFAASLGGP
jgi:branched-chain amino acid transport system substrate-binding protein